MGKTLNGKTWIVIIVSIICLTSLGLLVEILLFLPLLKNNQHLAAILFEATGITSIPFVIARGIISITKLLLMKKNLPRKKGK